MGMFDWITVHESLLPSSSILKEWGLHPEEFQTKDLDSSILNYKIDENGLLFREEVEVEYEKNTVEETELGKRWNPPFIEKEISREWVFEDLTGEVIIYCSMSNKETEDVLWLEYKLIIVYGELKKIDLIKEEISLGVDLKKNKEKWEKLWEEKRKDPIYNLYNFISLRMIRRLINFLHKIDSYLTSYKIK